MQATSFAPQTPVKVKHGTHKGKKGNVGEGIGTGRNRGKIPVELGRFKQVRWINPDWVEAINQVDIPSAWKNPSEFSLVTESGVAILVKFKPGFEGEIVAHQFDFTGPISPTGFKSHFVLGTESEEYQTPYDYAQAYAEALVSQLEPTALGKKRSPQEQKALAALPPATDKDSSRISTALAKTSIRKADELEPVNSSLVGVTPVAGMPEDNQLARCSPDSVSLNHIMTSETVIGDGETPEADDELQATVDGTESKASAVPQITSEGADFLNETKTPVTSSPALLNPVPEATGSGTSTVGVLEPLTPEEESSRHRLELKVERAFYEAGSSLRQLRDRRLYRSTHKTFEQYCRERFGFTRQSANYLIAGSQVVENLILTTNGCQILPTSERQVRPLTPLEPEEQRQVWKEAVESVGGKVPSGKIVKGILSRRKQRDSTPPAISYQVGDVVEIRAGCNPDLRKHDGCWGIVTHVGSFSCKVHISVRSVDVQCKPDEMDNVDPKYTTDVRAVSVRIKDLARRDDLASTALAVLEALSRKTCFTDDDLWFLEKVEERYKVKQ